MLHRFRLLLLTILSLAWLLPAPPSSLAQTDDPSASQPPPVTITADQTYFPEVGHYLSGAFRTFWQDHGGLAQFGYPLTEPFTEQSPTDGKTYTVQYFERERFELHPEFAGTPYEVELGLLGRQLVAGRHFPFSPAFTSNSQRLYFPETQHSLSYSFKQYWEAHGGLAIYGYPISEEIQEDGYTVQYFERARFEYHPENASPYDVLLGLLGTQTWAAQGHALPQIFRLDYAPDSIVQGRSTEITLNGSNMSGREVTGSFNGATLNFQTLGDRQVAIAGVASNAALKPQALTVELTDDTGVLRRFDRSVNILAGQFDHQTLSVEPVASPDEVAAETARDFSFYNQYTPQKFWQGTFIWPATGTITTQFGTRRDYDDGTSEIHDGIDIALDLGTPIQADAAGRVVLAEFQKERGNITIIDHGLGVHTAYFHQSKLLVKVGDMVQQGDVVGLAGTTGLSTGVHLHWEMRISGIGVDPVEWVGRNFN